MQKSPSSKRREFTPRDNKYVEAIKLDLDFDGFTFQKWGHSQKCKRNDWLIFSEGDTYTVDHEYFLQHFKTQSPGRWKKVGKICAEEAEENGFVQTLEGKTNYKKGDFIVSNYGKGGDQYAIPRIVFHNKYGAVDVEKVNRPRTERQRTYLISVTKKNEEAARSSRTNHILYWCLQLTSIIASALVPILLSLVKTTKVEYAMAVAGAVATVTSAVQGFGNFEEVSLKQKHISSQLETLIMSFEGGKEDFNGNDGFDKFMEEYEEVLKAEIWKND